ncbi:MAG: PVC-type heme-binding CxxCH protein, partial [Verrucomicrobiota bacterium]
FEGRLPQSMAEIYSQESIYLHERPRTELKLQALRIGELGIAAIPNEVFAITGLKLKAQSPLTTSFTIELANGAEGYIPPPEQHKLGGYTTWTARTAGLQVEAEPRILETALSLLEEVTGKSRRAMTDVQGDYPKAILAAKPVAFWRLNESVIPTAHDSSGNNHDAKFEDGVALYLPGASRTIGFQPPQPETPNAFSGDQINRAPHFAGGRLRSTLPQIKETYSVELWFWNGLTNNARPVTGYLFSRGADGDKSAAGDHLGIGGTNQNELTGKLIFFNGNERNTILAGHTEISWREWHHVVLVREGKRVTIYLDGNTTPEISGDADITFAPEEKSFFLGGRCDNFANLEGKLDEVAVYDHALKPEEISAHYKASGFPSRVASASPVASPPLSPAESLSKIHVRDGFTAELVAAEPLLESPVAIDWDERGRLWVVEMVDYPLGLDGKGKPGGRVRILEDTDGDGRYDKTTLFADNLNFPTGILTWRDGVLITAAPEILFLKDSDGDGKADVRKVLFSGFLEGNQQLRVNGLRWGLDNWIYCASGAHDRGYGTTTKIKSHLNGEEYAIGSRDFRFRPDTGELDAQSGPSQFGRNPDDWGNWFGEMNSWPLWHYVLQDHYIRRNPHVPAPDPVHQVVTPKNPPVFPASKSEKRFHSFTDAGHFTSACAATIYRDELLFGADETRHAFTCEPFHNLVQHNVVTDDGVTFTSHRASEETTHDFFASEDRWCRPVMTRAGPDGALWVVDMYRYIIEHPDWLPPEGKADLLPHYRLGEDRGRIYRVFPKNKLPRKIIPLATLTLPELVNALDSPNGWQRDKAQMLLLWKKDSAVVPLLEKLARENKNPLTRLHALCTLDGLGALKPALIEHALSDSHPGIRINALRLAEARATPGVIAAAVKLVNDKDPKVRLQLACTLGEWKDPAAGKALGQIAVANHADKFLIAAVMSSAIPHSLALVDAAVADGASALASLSEPLINLSLATGQRDSLARLLKPTLTPTNKKFSVLQ